MAQGNSKHDDNHVATLMAVSTADGITPVRVEADPSSGALIVQASSGGTLVTEAFDYVAATYPNGTTEVYTYKSGGVSGTTVATVTVVYSSSSKDILTSVTRS
jgi:hypothetical protein